MDGMVQFGTSQHVTLHFINIPIIMKGNELSIRETVAIMDKVTLTFNCNNCKEKCETKKSLFEIKTNVIVDYMSNRSIRHNCSSCYNK